MFAISSYLLHEYLLDAYYVHSDKCCVRVVVNEAVHKRFIFPSRPRVGLYFFVPLN